MEKQLNLLEDEEIVDIPDVLPLIPIREMVIFPDAIVPLLVGREKSVRAVQTAQKQHGFVLLTTQKQAEKEIVEARDLFRVGTVARILQVMSLPNGYHKIVVEALTRAKIIRFLGSKHFFKVQIQVLPEVFEPTASVKKKTGQLLHFFEEYLSTNPDLPEELMEHLQQLEEPERIIDFIAMNIQAEVGEKQKLLREANVSRRLDKLLKLLQEVISYHRVRQEIDQQVQENLMKHQRNFYLQEKLRIINQELGEEEDSSPELARLQQQLQEANLPEHAMEKALEELDKLKKTPPFSPEYTVVRNYLDWMLKVPWNQRSEDRLDIEEAQHILDQDHYGLEKPKERIIEHLAVLKRVKCMKGPILCLVGPPGVGKTSLGRSVARALGRRFVRVSLGGVRDEAEIRGHRRTYIGSMPGKIIQMMKKAGVKNPVFLLDEVDKMSMDFRGDPAAALLEVLDPEQNKHFNDHYLDVDYDLSEVFFITTANVRTQIPEPLLDRMEVIELPGYLEHEKIQIARQHLIPKQRETHGLSADELCIDEAAIVRMIREYTREAGVRNLERLIAQICRKTVRRLSSASNGKAITVGAEDLEAFLGTPPYLNRKDSSGGEVGVATGLAWTAYGGDLLKIEVNVMPGKGKLILTGKLGEVMKESAQTALSYIRSLADWLHIPEQAFEKRDIHVHIPEGAIPKDGPSAGITLATAMISALTGRVVRPDLAMTGEITLRGKILAVGGLNQKLLAAQRNGIRTVLLPRENQKDLNDLPAEIREGLSLVLVSDYREVLHQVLEPAAA